MRETDWGALRAELGPEYGPGLGHWFCVDHAVVVRPDTGRRFSTKPGGGRRVVLAMSLGPNATLFARSTSVEVGLPHAAHNHTDEQKATCKVDCPGWIDLRIPVSVPADALTDDTLSCQEPAGSDLLDELAGVMRP